MGFTLRAVFRGEGSLVTGPRHTLLSRALSWSNRVTVGVSGPAEVEGKCSHGWIGFLYDRTMGQ